MSEEIGEAPVALLPLAPVFDAANTCSNLERKLA